MGDDRDRDLFGNPVRANRGRPGRPALEVTAEDRDAVEAALVRGWSNERIARAVGISPASLKRYFRAALHHRDVAREKMELAMFATVARQAMAGNMSAVKQLRDMMHGDQLARSSAEMRKIQAEAEARGVGLGKKEAAQMGAQAASQSDEWGDLLKASGFH